MTVLSGEDLRRKQKEDEEESVRLIAEAEKAERKGNYKLKVIKK